MRSTVGMFDHRVMRMEVQRHDQRTGVVGRRQWLSFPTTGCQSQRRMLKLGFGRRECDGKLAEHLCVRVQGVTGVAPYIEWQRLPRRIFRIV